MNNINNLWHFGDSWGLSGDEKNFSNYLSEELGLNWCHRCIGGSSNQKIISAILKETNNFKNGDVILINWSYFVRPTLLFEDRVESSVPFEEENTCEFMNEKEYMLYKMEKIESYRKNNYEFFSLLSYDIIKPFLDTLNEKNIKIFHLFIDDIKHNFKLNDIMVSVSFEKFKWPGVNIDFKGTCYGQFLNENKLVAFPDEATHYPHNKQHLLFTSIYEEMKPHLIKKFI